MIYLIIKKTDVISVIINKNIIYLKEDDIVCIKERGVAYYNGQKIYSEDNSSFIKEGCSIIPCFITGENYHVLTQEQYRNSQLNKLLDV